MFFLLNAMPPQAKILLAHILRPPPAIFCPHKTPLFVVQPLTLPTVTTVFPYLVGRYDPLQENRR
jgi:hypothetical protein